jgi:hypothetical protein
MATNLRLHKITNVKPMETVTITGTSPSFTLTLDAKTEYVKHSLLLLDDVNKMNVALVVSNFSQGSSYRLWITQTVSGTFTLTLPAAFYGAAEMNLAGASGAVYSIFGTVGSRIMLDISFYGTEYAIGHEIYS